MNFSTPTSTLSSALLFALTVSAVALPNPNPNPESTSCINGKCVTGQSSTEASSINGVDSFKSDGNPVAGKPQAAPAASGVTGDGAQSSPFSSSSSSSSFSFSVGSTAGAMPDVKKFLEELSKQLGI